MRRTESIQQGPKEDGESVWNSYHNTQHLIGISRGTGDGATRLTERQNWDRGPAGEEIHQRHSHTTELGLYGMGNRCRESTPRGGIYHLDGRGGMGDRRSVEFWSKRGKFYNNIGTETLVLCQGVNASQRPTYDQLDKASVKMRDKRDEESACW